MAQPNQSQQNVLKLAAGIAVAMVLFPPFSWNGTNEGYAFLFEASRTVSGTVNISLLSIQLLVLCGVAFAAWLGTATKD